MLKNINIIFLERTQNKVSLKNIYIKLNTIFFSITRKRTLFAKNKDFSYVPTI